MDSRVGFRFVPTNEEIIFVLKKKRSEPGFSVCAIKEINIYSYDPWDLPQHSDIQSAEKVWYFFCKPYYKYAKSTRAHRRTNSGYWKKTSTDSDVKAKNSNDVIASKRILSFYTLGSDSKPVKTEWVMHEFYVEDDESLYKKDFVVCRIERKRDNKPRISTRQSSQNSVSSSTIHVTGDTFLECQLFTIDHSISHLRNHVAEKDSPASQLPPNHNLILHPRNHVAEKDSPASQLPPNHNLILHPRNHVAENVSPDSQLPPNHNSISHLRNHVAENASPESQLSPNHNSTLYLRSHVAKNASPESQLPPNHNSISHPRNHVAENTLAESQLAASHNFISYGNGVAENESPELQLPPNPDFELLLNECLVSYPVVHAAGNTLQAESLRVEELNARDGYNGLNDASVSSAQSPIYPEQESSYSNGSNNGCDSLNSYVNSEQVDCPINSQRAFNNEYSWEDRGHTVTPDFNSWKSNGGLYGADISDTDPETFNAWVNELFVY